MKTIDDYKTFLSQVRNETGIEALTSDESGLVTLNIDKRYNLNLQFVEATGKILCFIEIAELPKDASKKVYRDLLIGCLFCQDTAGGFFSLEGETETVIYNYFFDLESVSNDIDDFVTAIEKILQLCDIWANRIQEILDEDGAIAADLPSHFEIHP